MVDYVTAMVSVVLLVGGGVGSGVGSGSGTGSVGMAIHVSVTGSRVVPAVHIVKHDPVSIS